ncbi:hypothetical protein D3C87_1261810 [compost metagenome]
MAWLQSHVSQLSRVPSRDDDATTVRVSLQLVDSLGDLVDGRHSDFFSQCMAVISQPCQHNRIICVLGGERLSATGLHQPQVQSELIGELGLQFIELADRLNSTSSATTRQRAGFFGQWPLTPLHAVDRAQIAFDQLLTTDLGVGINPRMQQVVDVRSTVLARQWHEFPAFDFINRVEAFTVSVERRVDLFFILAHTLHPLTHSQGVVDAGTGFNPFVPDGHVMLREVINLASTHDEHLQLTHDALRVTQLGGDPRDVETRNIETHLITEDGERTGCGTIVLMLTGVKDVLQEVQILTHA